MFDRAIIETDSFLNISLSAKAIYFLLGMEADDEGFVSPNRIVRLYGGELGDIKNLIDVGLIIPFQSGVVVITDWNQNNWLDNRRIKPTQYQNEKKLLGLTQEKKYVLSNGLARGEERSIEQNRIDTPSKKEKIQNSIEYLKNIPLEDLKGFVSRFDASPSMIKSKAEDLLNYCRSKGKTYKDYSAFLLNALKKDFKPRRVEVRQVEEKLTVEQVERNKKMLEQVGSLVKRI